MTPEAKTIWDNILRMGSTTTMFEKYSPAWHEATRCRISGYLHAISDYGVVPKEKEQDIFAEIWLWYEWNKELKVQP